MNKAREAACAALIRQARAIVNAEGTGPVALAKIKAHLIGLASHGDTLFPPDDFAMPAAQGRNHVLALEDGDGMGLYLTIGLPGKEAAPHDHGVWCVHAGLSGREVNRLYRRVEPAASETLVEPAASEMRVEPAASGPRVEPAASEMRVEPAASETRIETIDEVVIAAGQGMAMVDHAIHDSVVVGDEPSIQLALYGYALARFPAVVWFHPDLSSIRTGTSRRPEAA